MQTHPVISSRDAALARPAALPQAGSVALQRLIEEVRQPQGDVLCDVTLYNRTYHRHNR